MYDECFMMCGDIFFMKQKNKLIGNYVINECNGDLEWWGGCWWYLINMFPKLEIICGVNWWWRNVWMGKWCIFLIHYEDIGNRELGILELAINDERLRKKW